MRTECNTKSVELQKHQRKEVVGRFDGGAISSDAGALLLRMREVNKWTRMIEQATACFIDSRKGFPRSNPPPLASAFYGPRTACMKLK